MRYLSFTPRHSPEHIGQDDQEREMFSCNYDVERALDTGVAATRLAQLEEDIITFLGLVAQVGTLTFKGRSAIIPAGVGPFTTVINTGGRGREITHQMDTIELASIQIITTGSFAIARALGYSHWLTLSNLINQDLG